jgi:tripartite-type tricarboxylate transporter receptor subunit TctC
MQHAWVTRFGAGKRHPLVLTLTALLLTALPLASQADDAYPSKPVRIIVPYAPGGSGDVFARLLAERLTSRLKQNFIVENRAGATGAIGTRMVADSPPDGEMLLMGQTGEIVVNPLVAKNLPYNPKDLIAVALVGDSPLILAAPAKATFSTIKELVAQSKSAPKGLTFASSGTATPGHLAGAALALKTGANLTHVPYKGAGGALSDLLGNHVDMFFSGAPAVLPHFKSGALKPIAVSTAKRSPALPDTPTVAESGYRDFEFSLWGGIFVSKGTPRAIVLTLNHEINAILADPVVKKRLEEDGAVVTQNTPEQFAQFVARESSKYQVIVNQTGISLD